MTSEALLVALVAAPGLLFAALAIVWESVHALLRGPAVENIDLGLLVLVGTSALNGLLGWYLVRVGRRHHSLALVADGRHVLTDVTTSAGVVAGLLAVRLTGLVVLDPLVAMAVAVFGMLRFGCGSAHGSTPIR